jgi:hypothetical protein
MKRNLILAAIVSISFITGYVVKPSKEYKVQDIYFDGEGNVIPNDIVQLLVTSQFVAIEQDEKEVLNSYFYFTK